MKGTLLSLLLSVFAFTHALAQTFPYPSIPDTLRTPAVRGAYLLEHYWDNFCFEDTTLIHQPDVTEQGFANFLDLLPRFDSLAAERGIEQFIARTYCNRTPAAVRNNFTLLLKHYLYDPNSPMRDDELYAAFLRQMEATHTFSDAEREQFGYLIANLEKNRVGTLATDFRYISREGGNTTLYETPCNLLLLYFYDPDCDDCRETTALLANSPLIVGNPRLKVLAIFPDDDTKRWRSHSSTFPATWIDAYSPSGEISARQLYFLRATPTLFLLDSSKRILLKDPTPQQLLQFLRR